ncbi:ATP-binding protein [Candidatus Alkanophaga liquidiphilum]
MARDEYVPRYEYERLESEYRRLLRRYEELETYKEELERLVSKAKAPPLDIGFIVEKLEDGAVVNINGALKVLPYGLLSDEEVRNLREGQYVFIGHIPDKKSPTGFTVGITRAYNKMVDLIVGEVEEIRCEGDEWISEISTGRGQNKIYKKLSEEEKKALKEGMKVGMIPMTFDIKRRYVTREFSKYEVTKSPGVSFNDIGGLREVKKELIRSIILPMFNPDDYSKYGEHSRRILMYGPPGCGKTMCAKALATALPNCEFVKVGAGELFSMWLGESERNVRLVFKTANEKLESGENDYGVIFFDEIDALAQERGMYVGSSGAPERVTGQLLDILEGFYDLHPHLTVIGATNRLHLIDSALRSRFDKIIEVPKPDKEAAFSIARIYARKVPMDALLVEELGDVAAAQNYLVEEIVDYMYTDDIVETEIGTIRRRDSVTGRFIAQMFYYARDRALEERTIFMLKKGIVGRTDIAEIWVREGLDGVLDVEERALELSKKYRSPSEIGVTLEHLKEGFNRFLKRRAEEMIAAGYHKKLEEDTGMHF